MVLDALENNGIRTMEQYQLCMGELKRPKLRSSGTLGPAR
jgi:hypothetical protein